MTKHWHRTFDDPVPLPGGGELRTLRDAGHYVSARPKAEQAKQHWQTAAHELMMAAERGISTGALVLLLLAAILVPPAIACLLIRAGERAGSRCRDLAQFGCLWLFGAVIFLPLLSILPWSPIVRALLALALGGAGAAGYRSITEGSRDLFSWVLLSGGAISVALLIADPRIVRLGALGILPVHDAAELRPGDRGKEFVYGVLAHPFACNAPEPPANLDRRLGDAFLITLDQTLGGVRDHDLCV